MSDETIIEKIGMQSADDDTKQSMIRMIKQNAEMRLVSTVGSLLDEEQMSALEEMQARGASSSEMFGYLGEQLANINELYDAALDAYIDEFVEKQKKYGGQ